MVVSDGNKTEKITFNIPVELKEKVISLKEELHVSLSTIYNEAITNYVRQKELEKWKKGVNMALKDETYTKFAEETAADNGELYVY